MNDIKQIELYKSRSYTACLTEAFNTCAHNLKTIFMHTWGYAVASAAAASLCVSASTEMLTSGGGISAAAWLLSSLLLSVAASVALFARATTLVNGRKTAWNIKRTARITLIALLFWLAVTVLAGAAAAIVASTQDAAKSPSAALAASAVANVLSLIVGLLALPYVYVFAKYMMEPDTKLRRLLFKSYKTGLRHWGFIFTTEFLAWLCMTVCAVIIALPAVIIISARMLSISGVNTFGDPTGLPAGFSAMQFGWFALATFIWSYISVFYMFVCYFIYGSIEARVKEKKEYLNTQREQNA